MKKLISIFMITIFSVAIFTGCGSGENDGSAKVLRFAYASNSQVVVDSMKEFGRLVEEKTYGEVKVEFYPDGQLGGERELIELTQTGAIDFTKVSGSALESFSSIYSIFGVPYIFDDEEHFYNVMEDPKITDEVYNSTKDLGFVGLTYYDSGQRSFYTKDKKITKPEDLKGLKIRVMQSATAIKMVQLLGGSPTPMSSSEVYTSLQQGIIDGSENNEFALTDARHAEVTKYYSYDSHTRIPDIIIMNTKMMEKLTESQREAIKEAAKESTEFEKAGFKQAVEDARKQCEEEFGMEFIEVDPKPFQEAVQPMHEEVKQDENLKTIYSQIRDLAK